MVTDDHFGEAEERADRERERAVQLGYRAVGQRERTVAELRTFLERKRVEPEAIEHAVAELRDGGLPRRRALRASASPRTSAASSAGAPSGSRATCAGAASRPA